MTVFCLWCILERSLLFQCSATKELMTARKTPFHSQAEKTHFLLPLLPCAILQPSLHLWPPLNLLHRLSVCLEKNWGTQTKAVDCRCSTPGGSHQPISLACQGPSKEQPSSPVYLTFSSVWEHLQTC